MKNVLQLLTLILLTTLTLSAQLRRHEINLIPNTSDALTGELRFLELRTNGTNYVGFQSSDSVASNVIWTLPNADSSGTQCLASNGSGTLSWGACSAGGSAPFVDTTSIVEGSGDGTKEIRFEVDGLTTSTVRVITPPDSNFTMAGINIEQTFTEDQEFENIAPRSASTYNSGEYAAEWSIVHSNNFRVPGPHSSTGVVLVFEDTGGGVVQIQDDDSASTPETVALIGADSSSDGYMELYDDSGNQLLGSGLLGSAGHVELFTTAGASCRIFVGTGAPTGTCSTCDLVLRTDGGSGTTLYICEATAWAAK